MKKIIGIMLLFLLGGILTAELVGNEFLTVHAPIGELQMQGFADAEIDRIAVLSSVLWERGKLLVLLLILCRTSFRKLLPYTVLGLCGFVFGFFGAACVILFGLPGFLLLPVVFLPHGIGYFLAGMVMYRMKPEYTGSGKRRIGGTLWHLTWIWILFLAGCLSETFLGTCLLQRLFVLLGKR